ncbi:MAG: hypothetical protein HGA45_27735 [Chloroflexales bacterium]|nr:hypothetical protein [Chloroflexales bacterium]
MTSFTTRAAAPLNGATDPTKHVSYTQGMILGVDDLNQEFAYLSGRDQSMARDLIGYGTVAGLDLTIETGARTEVVVSPGVALSQRGEIIRVARAQCADLVAWIAAQGEKLGGRRDGGVVPVYVVLSYRICLTDNVPIPGEPCRSEEEALAASRVADDFQLELDLQPPDQSEEDALRAYVAWLRQVQLAEEGERALTLEQFLAEISLAADPGSPPGFMDDPAGSPLARLHIPAERAPEYLRAAFRLWATDLRQRWWGAGRDSAGSPPTQGRLLLAELRLPLGDDLRLDPDRQIVIDERRRPYLLHLRMLQEWLLYGALLPANSVTPETGYGQDSDAGTASSLSRADHTHGTPPPPTLLGDVTSTPLDQSDGILATWVAWLQGWPLEAQEPRDGDVLTFVADVASPPDGSPPDGSPPDELGRISLGPSVRPLAIRPGSLASAIGLARPVIPTPRSLRSPRDFIAPAPRAGGRWVPAAPGGDVQGPVSDLEVAGLRRIPITFEIEPEPGQVLTLQRLGEEQELHWVPTVPEDSSLPPLAGDISGELEDGEGGPLLRTTVQQLQGRPLSAGEPGEGNVLTFREGQWQPEAPAGGPVTLDGDVQGDPSETVVVGLQRIPVDRVREPDAGQVLTLFRDERREGLIWRPADPTGASPIIAAGRFDTRGNTIESFNGLSAFPLAVGLFLLSFEGFEPRAFYVVKGTPVSGLSSRPATFEVIDPNDQQLREILARSSPPFDGIAVRIAQMSVETSFGFMVEISRFPSIAR